MVQKKGHQWPMDVPSVSDGKHENRNNISYLSNNIIWICII